MESAPNHQVFQPDAIQIEGNSQTGHIHLYYRSIDKNSIAVDLSHEMIHQTVSHLVSAISQSPNSKTQALSQLFALRNISARLHGAGTITLRYETEAGAIIETTIDRKDAELLRDQLTGTLNGQIGGGSETSH